MRNLFKRLALVSLIWVSLPSVEMRAETIYVLSVWTSEGKTSFALNEHPEIVQTGDYIMVTSSVSELQVLESDVIKYTLEATDEDLSTSVGEVKSACGEVLKQGNMVYLTGYKPHTGIYVYALNGISVAEYNVEDDGCLSFSIESLPKGVYLLKTDKKTYKIVKK